MREFQIKENDADQRVDKFLQKTLQTLPKSLMYKYIRNKKIKVNRKRCEISQRLQVGDTIQCYIAEEFFEVDQTAYDFMQIKGKLKILYEDEDILVVDKPCGLLAHKDVAGVQDNLSDRILHYLYQQGSYDPALEHSFVPALCHRIDRNTQGIVIAAKNAAALRGMNEHIRQHEVTKKYLCIAQGVFQKKHERVVLYHKKDEHNKAIVCKDAAPGFKRMESIYTVKDQGKQYALVEVELCSGRSHQIRAMLSYLHHPLLGDVKYGARIDHQKAYQELCAYRIEFHFPKGTSLDHLNQKVLQLEHIDLVTRYHTIYKDLTDV